MGEDRTARPGATNQRVTVPEAAELLGITAEAVRMRIKRATLRSERQAGRVFVLLGPERPTEHTTERTEPTEDRTAELIDTLREQLQAERQAHAEARRIIAGLVERIPPAMEAPAEAREAPETVAEESERAEHYSATAGSQEGAQRPWWRRIFGGRG